MISSKLIAAAVLATGGTAAFASPYIGVQVNSTQYGNHITPLGPLDEAGVVQQDHFNSLPVGGTYPNSIANLTNASGTTSGVSLTTNGDDNVFFTGTGDGNSPTNDAALLGTTDKTDGTATYTFSNVPAGTYDVIVYTEIDVYAAGDEGAYSVTGSPTIFYITPQSGSNYGGSYVTTNNPSNFDTVNYIEFDGIAPSSGDIVVTDSVVLGQAAVSAIQLVAVPEPASISLLSLAAVSLLRRRRRA
jgi:hypothetical protein